MIRASKHTLKYNTNIKNDHLDKLFHDYKLCLIHYINLIKLEILPLSKNLSSKDLPNYNISHSQWKQIIYKNASEIVKSSIKRYLKNKYKRYKKAYKHCLDNNKQKQFTSKRFNELNLKINLKKLNYNIENITINLDSRLFNIKKGNTFDEFIRVRLPDFNKINIPIKHHKHSLKFNNWNRKNTIQLLSNQYGYFIGLIYKKDEPTKINDGKTIGIDIGYKKLITTSDNRIIKCIDYNKITRKARGSKAYKRALIERDNKINEQLNNFDLKDIKEIVVEDLKKVKHKSKFNSKFNNRLQYWTYPKVVNKLKRISEENGIFFTKVNPAYTSQCCNKCGFTHRNNRKSELFLCVECGYSNDADINAALNISSMGIYSSHTTKS